jgi:hypothetical protein
MTKTLNSRRILVTGWWWGLLICALLVAFRLFSPGSNSQLINAKKYTQKPLDNALEGYIASDI